MRNVRRILAVALVASALPACQKAQPQRNEAMSVDDNVGDSGLPANADIETLPPDESSTTPSNQLQNGVDNPDVNELGNGH